MSRRYFVGETESLHGEGKMYVEFTGQRATRQCERYPLGWVSADDEREVHVGIGPGLTELTLSEAGFRPEDEISAEVFEDAWREAREFRRNFPSFVETAISGSVVPRVHGEGAS